MVRPEGLERARVARVEGHLEARSGSPRKRRSGRKAASLAQSLQFAGAPGTRPGSSSTSALRPSQHRRQRGPPGTGQPTAAPSRRAPESASPGAARRAGAEPSADRSARTRVLPMIGATPRPRGQMTTETETAFTELLAEVRATHARMVEQLADDDRDTLLEAHKWVLSILQVAAEVNIWADKARPRFVEIVGPVQEVGRRQRRRLLLLRPDRPGADLPGRLEPGDAVYMSLTVYGGPDDGRYSTRIVGSASTARRAARAPTAPSTSSLSPIEPTEPGVGLDPPGARRRGRHHAGLSRGPVGGAAGRVAHRGRRPAGDLPPGRRRPGPAHPGRDDLGARAGQHRADPPRHTQRHRSALPGADHHLRLGGRRRRLRHGRLRAGRRRGAGHPGPFARVRLLEHVPVEPAAPHLQLRLRAGDHQRGRRSSYESDGSWIIVVSARRPAHPNWVSTAGHRTGRIWFRWFLPAATPEQPQVEVLRWTPYERPPGARPHRRPGGPQFSATRPGPSSTSWRRRDRSSTLDPAALMDDGHARDRAHDFGPADFVERLDVLCRAMRDEGGFNGAGVMQQHTLHPRPAEEPAAHRGPRAPPPRDPRRADHRADRHLRPAPDRNDPPAQPDVGRPCPALAPLLGEPRAGPGRR